MTILIVTESCFGNTATVAQALAEGLTHSAPGDPVTVVRPDDAPTTLPPDIRLLLVGAPTHAFSLPRPQSRREAAKKGARDATGTGVREWIANVAPAPDLRVVTFDTSIRSRFTPGSAAKASTRALKRRGFRHVERGPSFFVTDTGGPLAEGERQRAQQFGATLDRAPGMATLPTPVATVDTSTDM